MKIHPQETQGSVLTSSVVIMSILTVSLITYLSVTAAENRSVRRSQAWNTAIAAAEAGLEEAMTQLNYQEGENLSANDWNLISGQYTKQRTLETDSYFVATISDDDLTIHSTGFVRMGAGSNYISRTVEATVDTANTIFTQALIAKKHIKLRAKLGADSYDGGSLGRGKPPGGNGNGGGGGSSTNSPGKGGSKGKGKGGSGNGNSGLTRGYDKNNFKDNFGVAATSSKKNGIKVDSTKVYGSAQVAPKGNVEFKNKGVVGSMAWIGANKTGMDPDRFSDSFRYTFPEVQPPFTNGAFTPSGGKVDGVEYQYILGTDNYQLGKVDLKKPILVTGDAVLYVTDKFKSDNDKDIVFANTNATLKLYCAGDHFHASTKNVANSSVPASFQYYGLGKNKCVKIEKDADYSSVIYAPRARIHLKGNGDFYGSAVGKCIHISGDGACHYDEALSRLYGDFEKFVITGWREL